MFRLTLRKKLLLFTIVIAIVPLLVAGRTMIRIAEDELKSSVNEQLVTTAEELAHEIDTLFERTARIDLRRLGKHVEEHQFIQTGSITIVDRFAHRIFDPEQPDLRHYQIVGEAMGLLASGARVVRTARYAGPDGRVFFRGVRFSAAREVGGAGGEGRGRRLLVHHADDAEPAAVGGWLGSA